jgi:PAS domain S-box-containing protein
VQEGLPIRATGLLLVADFIEILVAAFGLTYVFGGVLRLNSVKSLAKYSFFAVILAPLSVASAAASAFEQDSWWVAFFTEALALLTLTPAILSWADIVLGRRKKPRAQYIEAASMFVGLATFAFFTLVASRPASPTLLYSLVPFLLWAALRFGITGTSNSIVLVALLAIMGVVHGRGPFRGDTPVNNVLSLQLFLLVAASSFMVLAAVVEESKVAAQAARENAEAVRASEERLRLAQQAARIGTFESNIRTGVSIWTPELEAIYGLPPGGFGGTQKAFENLVHPDDLAGVIELVERSLKSGQSASREWRVVWPDGSVHWIAGRWQALMDESGTPLRVVGVNIDVTERRRSEERLREYEKAVEGAEDMIGVIDREYRFLLANRQYLKMRNMTREQVVGHFIPEVLNREVFETVIKPKLDECFQGKVVKYEMKLSYPTVGERDLLLSYFPIEGVNGIDRAACILRDITDRKRAEEALLEMNRALEAQSSLLQSREELLKIFVKNVPAGVAMLDRDMRYLQVSDRWCADYSVDSSEILGRSHYDLLPDMPEHWREVHRRSLEGETLRADDERWDRKGGTTVWVRWEIRPWRTSSGIIGGLLIFAEDITQRKQMQDALSTISRKLIESQEQERTRIGRELHDDINQRIAMLTVELEQLQGDPSDVQNRLQDLRKQMVELSNDVQGLSHELHSSKLEYLGVVSGMRSWCKEFGQRRNMVIDFKSDVSSVVPFDIGISLFRVLQEALHNADKHSAVKRMEVEVWEASNEVHLLVADLGKGFNFDAAIRGQGLGLTSMQERVRLVGGTISITSKPMGGTTIHVRVPFEQGREVQRANTG